MTTITDENIKINDGTSIALGNFDGLHTAHRQLIGVMREYGALYSLRTVVLAFDPHPALFLGNKSFQTILTPEEKSYLIKQMGVEFFVQYPFNENTADMQPEDFFRYVLVEKLGCKALTVGEDYRFGKDKKGTCNALIELGHKYSVLVNVIPTIKVNGNKVSSTSIRRFITEKDFRKIQQLLGLPYFIMGKVETGKSLGRKIGYPTLNIAGRETKLYPPNGVYITTTEHKHITYHSITNIGTKPTVNGTDHNVETYVFDFDKEIYGDEIIVNFYEWIRDEKKFDSVEQLIEQIRNDVIYAEQYFRV